MTGSLLKMIIESFKAGYVRALKETRDPASATVTIAAPLNHKHKNCSRDRQPSFGENKTVTSLSVFARCLLQAAFLFALVFGGGSETVAQQLDASRQSRVPIRAPLLWENVQDSCQYVRGILPKHSIKRRLSLVTLKPGEYTEFLVPAHEMIRVKSCCNEQLSTESLQVWTSNGSGIFRLQNSAVSSEDHSLLAVPDHSGVSVASVRRPPTAAGSITIAVFTSRRTSNRLLDYYQCPVLGAAQCVRISDDITGKKRKYCLLQQDRRHVFQAKTPARIRIETRLQYDQDQSQEQNYNVRVYAGGVLKRILVFDTLPQRRHRNFVDGCERLIGRREFAYIDLDCDGQPLEIEISRPAYVRINSVGLNLCRPQVNQIFSLPALDHANKCVSCWNIPKFDPAQVSSVNSFLNEQHANLFVENCEPKWNPYLVQQGLQRLARDNQIPDGGLTAYMWMRAIATRHYGDADFGDEISVPELADRLRERTFYRDMLPFQSYPREMMRLAAPRKVSFPVQKIRRPKQKVTETIVGQQHIEEALERLPTATLFRLPTDCRNNGHHQKLHYRKPDNLGPSMLRLVVDQQCMQAPAWVNVQYDDRPPIRLRVNKLRSLGFDRYVPGRAEAALASYAHVHNRYDAAIVGGPFNVVNETTKFTDAATTELMLPTAVKNISVWAESDGGSELYIGLQHLAGRYYDLSESAFRSNLEVSEKDAHVQVHAFANDELNNASIDLKRMLISAWRRVKNSIRTSDQLRASSEIWGEFETDEAMQNALKLASANDWVPAIEKLTELIHHTKGHERQQAILARNNALESTGEFFLANRERLGWFEHEKDPQFRTALLDQAISQARENAQAPFAVEELLSYSTVEQATVQSELDMAREFLKNGHYRFALFSLPDDAPLELTSDIALRCCFQLRWWKTLEEILSKIDDRETSSLWLGLKALRLGQYERAHALLTSAGEAGHQWLVHWEAGHKVFQKLVSDQSNNWIQAIPEWEAWQASHPGPRVWQAEPWAIKAFDGAAVVYSRERDLRAQHFLTDADSPATIQIHGPVRIRIEARPIHTPGIARPVQDWLTLSSAGRIQRVPVINNHVSNLLEVEGNEELSVGGRVFLDVDLPAGLNELKLSAADSPLLFRLLALRPELKSPVLPTIGEVTMAASLQGKFGAQNRCKFKEKTDTDCVRLICRDQECVSLPLNYLRPCRQNCDANQIQLTTQNHDLAALASIANRVKPTEQPFTMVHIDATYQHAIELAYFASQKLAMSEESDSTEAMEKVAELFEMTLKNNHRQDIRRLLDSLKAGASWVQLKQFDERAGVIPEPIDGWVPENPALRIRKCLLGSHEADYVLNATQELTLEVAAEEETEFEFTFWRPRVSFLPTTTSTIEVQVGDDRSELVLEGIDEQAQMRIKLAAGTESIKMQQVDAYVNHFVHVSVRELDKDGNAMHLVDGSKEKLKQKRIFQVATKSEPLKFRVSGPAVIRVDRLEAGESSTETIPIGDHAAEFTLKPDKSRLAKFRIYKLALDVTDTPSYRAQHAPSVGVEQNVNETVQAVYEEIETVDQPQSLDSLSLRPADLPPVQFNIQDSTRLGLQELGTIGLHLGYRQRRSLDEFPNPSVADEFFEARISRDKYDPWRDRYLHHSLLVRPRLQSGPAFGLIQEGRIKLPIAKCNSEVNADGWGPYSFSWNASAFAQNAGTPILPGGNSTPWIASFNGGISRRHQINECWQHQPRLSFFARELSEDSDNFPPGELDQDIFTQFKADHRFGLRYTDRFVYQPCLDRRFWIRPSIAGNEDQLVPDNLGVQFGTDQLLGPVQLRLAYRLRGFLADNDRTNASLQNLMSVDVDFEHWHNQFRRTEMNFSLRHDLNSGGTSVGFNVSSFLNHARGYRDFRPETLLFRSLREERAAKHYFYNQP